MAGLGNADEMGGKVLCAHANHGARDQLEYFTAKMSDGMLEDLSNIESTQRGTASGAKPFLILQDGELLIRHSLEQAVPPLAPP